jgi:hypothetical protein
VDGTGSNHCASKSRWMVQAVTTVPEITGGWYRQ